MKNNLQIQFLSRLAIAAVIIFSTDQRVQAQASGGDFDPSQLSQSSQVDEHKSDRQLPSGFNALPFRNKNAQPSSQVIASLARTNSAAHLPGHSSEISKPAQFSTSTLRPSSNGMSFGAANHPLVAQPVSFGKSPGSVPPQITSKESLQDEKDGTGFVQEMPKYVDLNCSVKFIDDIRLPAKEAGVIKLLDVKEGDFVPAGKTVGQIDDELYRQMYEQAEMRYKMALDTAEDETAKQAAQKKFGITSIEAEKVRKLWISGSRSDSERRMSEYQEELAGLEIVKAEMEMKKAKGEAELELARMKEVETRIRRHILHSDFDAYVIEIFKKPQEFVNVGEEVMRIARMDKLWVQGIVDIRDLNPHEAINRTVTVTVPLARGKTTTFEGKIVNVALERQSSQHYMVKAEIKNRPIGGHWVLHPFSEVQMRIHLDKPSDTGAAEALSVKR